MSSYLIIIPMTFLGALASLFFKKASGSADFKALLFNLNLYIGGILYVIAALVNIYVLKFLDYSVVLPLTSITYIWTMILSHFVLKEHISRNKIIGVVLIFIGAVCVGL